MAGSGTGGTGQHARSVSRRPESDKHHAALLPQFDGPSGHLQRWLLRCTLPAFVAFAASGSASGRLTLLSRRESRNTAGAFASAAP